MLGNFMCYGKKKKKENNGKRLRVQGRSAFLDGVVREGFSGEVTSGQSEESDGVSHSDVWEKSLLGREEVEVIFITHITGILFLHFNNVIHSSLLLAFLPLFIITHVAITNLKHSAQHPGGGASVLGQRS